MSIPNTDLVSWSLFAMTPTDQNALAKLSASSILADLNATELAACASEIQGGRRVALSLKTPVDEVYCGLCVFGLESPSPAADKALALQVLSLDQYPSVENTRAGRSHPTATALLDELRRFCLVHGYTRVKCLVPGNPDAITLLIRHGFEPEGATSAGETRLFSLAQHIPAAYTGDPYDGKHLLNWLTEQLRLDCLSSGETACEAVLSFDRLNRDLANTAFRRVKIPIYLELNSNPNGGSYLRIGISNDGGAAANFSLDELRALAGVSRLDMTLWPPSDQGASVAVEIRSDFFRRFRTDRTNAFFYSGSFGTLLEHGLEHGMTPSIFFVDFATTTSNPRLIGVGKVKSVHRGLPNDLWREWGSISSWADWEEFSRYRGLKRKMTVIIFDKLRIVDVIGAGLPAIGQTWAYVPARQAYAIDRQI
jgi:hypothetical protein